jgi:hypothetical protein
MDQTCNKVAKEHALDYRKNSYRALNVGRMAALCEAARQAGRAVTGS